MEERYDPARIERAAQEHWLRTSAFKAVEDDPRFPRGKYYVCSMLPYPSGALHMGHVRVYTIGDVVARQRRMLGYNVLLPMGWDAFGLPAENAAIKSRVAPAKWTYDNIAHMKSQLQRMGVALDWSRELATCRPDYYRWNQWLFLKMRERGIAYRKLGTVNWDPADQTVLANEQVIDGRGWRSGALVEKREIPMYYLRITDYAAELLEHIEDHLDGWPDRVRVMQSNWIGRSEGVRFAFPHDIDGDDGQPIGDGRLHVFTTRADTIMGVTFVAVAPEHPLAVHAAGRDPAVAAFVEQAKTGTAMEADLATIDKQGIKTGLVVRHPLTGEPVDVWVGNYVLMGYGDGAVMGVPAHDERDFAFALKYGLPIRQVIEVEGEVFSDREWQPWYEDKQRGRCMNSGKYDGLDHATAVRAIAADLGERGLGELRTQWRLRDWGISRQRYWGTPIPIIHCPDCGEVPVPEADLPVILPEGLVPDGSGNPLNKDESFLACKCPQCGKAARRETDTMDTFVDSSWYMMRYCTPGNDAAMTDSRVDYWMPMDLYIGGIEHAVLHLLYARFWTKVMRDLDLLRFDEPFTGLLTQGMVLNHIYQRRTPQGGIEYFWPADVENVFGADGRISGAKLKSDGSAVEYAGVGTMSKSRNNGIDPQSLIDRYGADTARLFVMFASPPEQTLEWSDSGVEGASRFLRRLWAVAQTRAEALRGASDGVDGARLDDASRELRFQTHSILRQANFDYERLHLNTVVSAGMKMLNALEAVGAPADAAAAAVQRECLSVLVRVLYPVVPHVTHEIWQALGLAADGVDLIHAPWPAVDEQALVRDEIELVLQVNGKTRGAIRVPAQADEAAIEAVARAAPEVARHADGREVRRVILVKGRLVNVVV